MGKIKPVYAFIDASNLFYGGEKSLGRKIDYQKLIRYLKKRYKVLRQKLPSENQKTLLRKHLQGDSQIPTIKKTEGTHIEYPPRLVVII